MTDFELAQKQLANIETSLKRAITQIENSCIETSLKCQFVADLEEIGSDIHHLAPMLKIPTLECLRCGHTWRPRGDWLPKVCPKCKSPYWNKPRKKGG